MLPYEVKYKYDAITATTTILVNGNYYDSVEDFVGAQERPHLTHTILSRLYAEEAQKEISALRRENQQLKAVLETYKKLEAENEF